MFTYSQSSGEFTHDGELLGVGYSGSGEGKNNPALQNVHDVGPIPQGQYIIGKMISPHPELGTVVYPLIPQPDTDTYWRSGFFIHGDSITHPGRGSHGCIILSRQVRLLINTSMVLGDCGADRDLTVTP